MKKKKIGVKAKKNQSAYEPLGCIYLLRNLVDGKGYVGQHNNVVTVERKRWRAHIIEAISGKGVYPLYRAIRKYGTENFSAEIIWRGPVSRLNEKETYYIKKLHTFIDDPVGAGGYNLRADGVAAIVCEATRARISAGLLKRYAEDPTFSVRVGAGVRAAMQADPTILQKISALGRKRSEESKRAASESKIAFYAAHPERKAECGAWIRGKNLSPEHCAKLAAADRSAAWASKTAEELADIGARRWDTIRANRAAAKAALKKAV